MRVSLALSAGALLGALCAFHCGSSGDASHGGPSPIDDASTNDPTTSGPDGTGATADGGVDSGPLSASYVDYDINHVIVTGQSNSVANGGQPPLTTTQPFGNLMFDTGPMSMKGAPGDTSGPCDGSGCVTFDTPTSLVPLKEGDRFFDYAVETSASSTANQISFLAGQLFQFGTRDGYPRHHDILASVVGRSGNTYWCLRKNGCTYKPGYLQSFAQAMSEVAKAKALASASGKSYVVRAVDAIHGESDHYGNEFPLDGTDGTPDAIMNYGDGLLEWQRDYEHDVRAITAQKEAVPLFISGMSGWTDVEESPIVLYQLAAHVRAPGKVILVGPTYPIPNASDCLHFTSEGQERLGEYFAKVYAAVVLGGRTWEPVRPKTISHAGATITVRYYVPVPPLVVDTDQVAMADNLGFKVYEGANALSIANVAVTAPDTVTITLGAVPGGGALTLRYGMAKIDGSQCIGPQHGPRGNIRDSDATPSKHGFALPNWGVQFDQAVP